MHRLAIVALTVSASLLTLTGCSSSDSDPKPEATTAPPPSLSAAQQREACVEALAATIAARPDDFDPETDTDPKPAACSAVPEDEYLDAYMDGLQQANKEGLDALKKAAEDAASAATPSP